MSLSFIPALLQVLFYSEQSIFYIIVISDRAPIYQLRRTMCVIEIILIIK